MRARIITTKRPEDARATGKKTIIPIPAGYAVIMRACGVTLGMIPGGGGEAVGKPGAARYGPPVGITPQGGAGPTTRDITPIGGPTGEDGGYETMPDSRPLHPLPTTIVRALIILLVPVALPPTLRHAAIPHLLGVEAPRRGVPKLTPLLHRGV